MTYLITQFLKKKVKKISLGDHSSKKKRGGGLARYDRDHRFNGFWFDAYLKKKKKKKLSQIFIHNCSHTILIPYFFRCKMF